jgi:hypothetical protein
MMLPLFLCVLSCFFLSAEAVAKPEVGGPCLICTLALSVVEQLALIRNQTVFEVLDEVCIIRFLPFSYLPLLRCFEIDQREFVLFCIVNLRVF